MIGNWIQYAAWETDQRNIDRARSVYERALDVEPRNTTLWLKYAEMEMREKQINHARNLWDRATLILPRVSAFWQKYTYMEEMLKNILNARQIFERWMEWHPEAGESSRVLDVRARSGRRVRCSNSTRNLMLLSQQFVLTCALCQR